MLSSLALQVRGAVRSAVTVRAGAYFSSFASLSPEDQRVEMEKRLTETFGDEVVIADVSGGQGSKYRVEIVSSVFNGLSIIKQHRLVNECLAEPLKTVHAISIQTRRTDK